MDDVLGAVESFLEHLASIAWGPLALALLCHLARIGARTRSWRNIIAASYPAARVRWRSIFGAYVAGVTVNAILPARAGDVLRLYLVKHRVEGSAYPTLAATLLVETLFDFVVASLLLVWALSVGVLPGLDVVPRLPPIDWFWLFQHPRAAAAVGAGTLIVAVLLGLWASARISAFWKRVAAGFVILRTPGRYIRQVVLWQAVDWTFRLAAVFFFLRAFGIGPSLDAVLRTQVAHSLATLVPLTPGGIGTEQALIGYVLAGEASHTAVLSFSVGMKLTLFAANALLGFAAIALMLRTVRWRRIVARDAQAASAGMGSTPPRRSR